MRTRGSTIIRRFLLHVLPDGFHRIRHYGLFASASRADNLAQARELLAAPTPQTQVNDADAVDPNEPPALSHPCPCCGGRMIIIESFEPGIRWGPDGWQDMLRQYGRCSKCGRKGVTLQHPSRGGCDTGWAPMPVKRMATVPRTDEMSSRAARSPLQ